MSLKDDWKFLETFLAVKTRALLLASDRWRPGKVVQASNSRILGGGEAAGSPEVGSLRPA